jgi:hypothetical protein
VLAQQRLYARAQGVSQRELPPAVRSRTRAAQGRAHGGGP